MACALPVLALGDSSYVNFCEIGRRIDRAPRGAGRRAHRAAGRLRPRLRGAGGGLDRAARSRSLTRRAEPDAATVVPRAARSSTSTSPRPRPASLYSKANPFAAEITEQHQSQRQRSTKQTIHLELSLEGSGLAFEPGDSLGIVPRERSGDGRGGAARRRPRWRCDLAAAAHRRVRHHGAVAPGAWRPTPRSTRRQRCAELLAGDGWRAYVEGRQIVDLLEDFPAKLAPAQLTGLLRKLPPRLYSVASSLAASARRGASSGRRRALREPRPRAPRRRLELRRRAAAGRATGCKVYVKPNKNFRLPDDPDRPLDHDRARHRRGAVPRLPAGAPGGGRQGRNWLFFGDRNYTHDFLYQLEWQELAQGRRADASSTSPSRAISRRRSTCSTACGSAAPSCSAGWRTARISTSAATRRRWPRTSTPRSPRSSPTRSGRSAEAAEAYLADLKKQQRYQRDVY